MSGRDPISPPIWRLVGPNGEHGGLFASAAVAADAAKKNWPNHHQDDSGNLEEPNGWDILAIE